MQLKAIVVCASLFACGLGFAACTESQTLRPRTDGSAGGGGRGGSGGTGTGSGGIAAAGQGGAGGDTTGTGGGGATGTGGSGTGGGLPDGGLPDGCVATVDTDLDGVPDCIDGCPGDAFKTQPGTCGCNVAKIEPGVCGCNLPDSDSDLDGTFDCNDLCPSDPMKTAPATCGCGRRETDTDGDLVLDCTDRCPRDATKTIAIGTCGCNVPDSAAPMCLAHRYSFVGPGPAVVDSVNPAGNGTVVNTTLGGTGVATLGGGVTDQYIDLPNGMISSFDDVTYEIWATWNGPAIDNWTRIIDFGSSTTGEGLQGDGVTYFFITPRNSATGQLRVAFSNAGIPGERVINGALPLSTGTMHHLAVVITKTPAVMTFYLNGALVGQIGLLGTPQTIDDVNSWLGRSQFVNDVEFGGTITEFRVFGAARTAGQIMTSSVNGPDVPPAP